MSTATLSSKGQVTIPKKVREALRLEVGDRLAFEIRDDGVVEMHPETVDILSLCGIIKPKVRGVTLDKIRRRHPR